MLLADNAVLGRFAIQQLADGGFGLAVGLGDRGFVALAHNIQPSAEVSTQNRAAKISRPMREFDQVVWYCLQCLSPWPCVPARRPNWQTDGALVLCRLCLFGSSWGRRSRARFRQGRRIVGHGAQEDDDRRPLVHVLDATKRAHLRAIHIVFRLVDELVQLLISPGAAQALKRAGVGIAAFASLRRANDIGQVRADAVSAALVERMAADALLRLFFALFRGEIR